MGVIIHIFNLNISLKMSYCMLECDIMLWNYMLMIFIIKDFVIKEGFFVPEPCKMLYTHFTSIIKRQ